MDILSKSSIEIASLALDGLSARHKAISSNVANADSPDYKKVGVSFEDQLKRIINTEDKKQQYKLDNMFKDNREPYKQDQQDMEYSDFNPKTLVEDDGTGKNAVNIETEMSELAKNSMKYNALAIIQQKAFKGLSDLIQQGGR